jgi:hypothetical protein
LRVVSILEAASKSLGLSGKAVPLRGLKLMNQRARVNGNGNGSGHAVSFANGWK